MALCDRRFSATQYALLSALSAVGRVYVGPVAGYLVEALGWQMFFLFTFVIALPGLTPRSPKMTEEPVLVTVEPPSTPNELNWASFVTSFNAVLAVCLGISLWDNTPRAKFAPLEPI